MTDGAAGQAGGNTTTDVPQEAEQTWTLQRYQLVNACHAIGIKYAEDVTDKLLEYLSACCRMCCDGCGDSSECCHHRTAAPVIAAHAGFTAADLAEAANDGWRRGIQRAIELAERHDVTYWNGDDDGEVCCDDDVHKTWLPFADVLRGQDGNHDEEN